MALHGTLEDFGVAEILQLIAQQTKTGILRLRKRRQDEEVCVHFDKGNVVRAEQVTGKEAHLFGHRLVRAGLVTEEELASALEEQRRTLRRLGDVLVASGAISRDDLREMAQLQATETLYRLFTWTEGTYEFEATEVTWDSTSITPIRGEAILMEGFRMVDEWPLIKQRIPSRQMRFHPLRVLPGEGTAAARKAEIGESERRVMALIEPDRTVERLIELSRLGEFETCKALHTLVSGGWLRGELPAEEIAPEKKGLLASLLPAFGSFAVQVAFLVALIAVAVAATLWARSGVAASSDRGIPVTDDALRRSAGETQDARLRAALEVWRLERGSYPDSLQELHDAGLLSAGDLRHPFEEPWHYRRAANSFVLLPPLR